MSHFTVLVVGEDPEAQLAPFCEQDEAYFEFVDDEDEYRQRWAGGEGKMKSWYPECSGRAAPMVIDRLLAAGLGESLRLSLRELGNPILLLEGQRMSIREIGGERLVYAKIETTAARDASHVWLHRIAPPEEVTYAAQYGSFDAFCEEYAGLKRDPATGRWGHYSNPDAKWDWYQLGGRWRGFFKPKPGAEGTLGEPGVFDNEARDGWVDQLRKGDIDWGGMKAIAEREARERFDKYEELRGGSPPLDFVQRHLEMWENNSYPNGSAEPRPSERFPSFATFLDHWWGVQCAQKADILGYLVMVNEELPERQSYIRSQGIPTTYAVLMDGCWYERGEMGWFGAASNEKPVEQWDEEWQQLVMGLDDDVLLSVYDCHI